MVEIGERAPDGSEDEAIAALMYAAIHEGRSLYTEAERQAWMPKPYGGPEWSARLAGQRVFVARAGARVVGVMTLAGAYIDLAFVAPDHQGQGLFRKLYGPLQAAALTEGIRQLTTHASLMAQPAFRAMGFRVIRHEEIEQRGARLARAEMEKRLMSPEEIEALPYRPCVGVMLVNEAGLAFVGQRKDRYQEAWQMPQGGVDKGESPRDAALRELEEETGVTADLVTVEAETADWIPYDLPHEIVPEIWKGRFRGQEQKWFLMRFHGEDSDVDIETEHQEFSTWRWMPVEDLVERIVPFKRHVYEVVLKEFEGKL